ncbi:uncharacterized protein LY89DRAFT_738707 [Mollisia scopiformis]|uniref:RGS domain-containing protein n=1 Tax=Mollisia scopiformis TaxID=149040 RepID=A0A194WVU7_MOLSC|nr:uncharacterized protein LY89DRAFT_738707 [Mollisia scopiformis]KUJ12086.1 hypothetical protein LY89DRAFT_738707 [Mollisia scopiformis]
MRRSKYRKPQSLYIKNISRETSPRCSSVLSDWDADDEGFMSSGDLAPSRPLSLTIPSGPYCPRRPTLHEVLANIAPQPWTLTAFMAYLSQNHCLETLEFTMDAQVYSKHYQELVSHDPHSPLSPNTPGCDYVRMLWQKLLDAYIAPNGPREVNLPSDVRDHLMSLPSAYSPPDPAELDPAVKIIYELMDESVLVPFLNSIAPSRGQEFQSSPWTSNESMPDAYMTASLDERSLSRMRTRDVSPPVGDLGMDVVSQSLTGPSPRLSHSSHLTAALSRGAARLSTHLSGSSTEAPESMTDDSTDSPSPSGSALEPMTPPNTPPTSHTEFADASPGTSPHTGREGSSWKKMGAKLGWKKSRSGHGSGSSTSSSRYPMTRKASDETPIPVIAPMEHPVAGFSSNRDARKKTTALVHGGTSLRLSEGSESPVLEAHPGSPVDLTGPRPSRTTSMTLQRLYHGTDEEISKFEKKNMAKKEEAIRKDGVAAKGTHCLPSRTDGGDVLKISKRRLPGPSAFFIPAKVPEQEEVTTIHVPISADDKMALDVDIDSSVESTAMDFHFEEENGTWISAQPIGHESRTSLSTTTTGASTLIEDRMSSAALTLDTSVASSAASMMSSVGSIQSASTTTSADIYGWEEELDRKTSIESHAAWERELARRLPSGGRTAGPRLRNVHELQYKRADGKRKSLLYRVLNLSSRRGSADDVNISMSPEDNSPHCLRRWISSSFSS